MPLCLLPRWPCCAPTPLSRACRLYATCDGLIAASEQFHKSQQPLWRRREALSIIARPQWRPLAFFRSHAASSAAQDQPWTPSGAQGGHHLCLSRCRAPAGPPQPAERSLQIPRSAGRRALASKRLPGPHQPPPLRHRCGPARPSAVAPGCVPLPSPRLTWICRCLQLVELKNGETYNGHMVQCDTWMNIHLREVICTSKVRALNEGGVWGPPGAVLGTKNGGASVVGL